MTKFIKNNKYQTKTSIKLAQFKNNLYLCKDIKKQITMGEEIKNRRIAYFICCITAFAERYNLTDKQAFGYLQRFKGIDFLIECYEAEHQLSISDAVLDLTTICHRNGGKLI